MITVDNAPYYLIQQGLITPDAVIGGELDIISANRRNRNLQITSNQSGNYLIKQPDDPGLESAGTLRHEAAFYSFCWDAASHPRAITAILPHLIHNETNAALLVLELFRDALPLWNFYEKRAASEFPIEIVTEIGRTLGTLHHTFSGTNWLNHPGLAFLGREIPWAMSLHRPGPDILTKISRANQQIIQILQTDQNSFRQLDDLARHWQIQTVIHGDVKMDNFLVLPENAGNDPAKGHIRLVDWEFVQFGDPAWDLAGALNDFIFFWILSMPRDTTSLEVMVTKANYPLPVLQPAIAALWKGYCTSRSLTASEANTLLDRAVLFSAGRIIQTAYEMASHFPTIPAPAVLMLQIGVNLLKCPEAGRKELYRLRKEDELQ